MVLRPHPLLLEDSHALFSVSGQTSEDNSRTATCFASQNLRESDVLACVDTGCTRSLIGRDTLSRLRHMLKEKRMQVHTDRGECSFRFGGDFSYTSQDIAVIPCRIGRHMCSIRAFIVPGQTPLLHSLPLLNAWEAVI